MSGRMHKLRLNLNGKRSSSTGCGHLGERTIGEVSPLGKKLMGKFDWVGILHTGNVTIQQREPAGSILKSVAGNQIGGRCATTAGALSSASSVGKTKTLPNKQNHKQVWPGSDRNHVLEAKNVCIFRHSNHFSHLSNY